LGILVSLGALKNSEFSIAGQSSFGQVFYLIILLLPMLLPYILPFVFAISSALSFRELSQTKEYIALLTSGISVKKITISIFAIGTFFVLLSLIFQFKIAPDLQVYTKQYFKESAIHNPSQFISTKTFMHQFPGYIIYIDDKKNDELYDFCIWKYNNNGKFETVVSADSGNINYNSQKNTLELNLKNGNICTKIEDLNNLSFISFKDFEISLPLNTLISDQPTDFRNKKTRYMNISELLAFKNYAKDNKNYQQYISSLTQINMNIVMALVIFAIILLSRKLILQTSKGDSIAGIAILMITTMVFYIGELIISSLTKRPHCRPDILIWIPIILMFLVSFCTNIIRKK
jgi:lipopolysaccharide export system permease protein